MESPDGLCVGKPAEPAAAGAEDPAEPCTQPLDDGEDDTVEDSQGESSMDVDQSQIFGYLLPLKPAGPLIPIDVDVFKVGRSVRTNHVVQKSSQIRNFEAISKVHFELRREPGGVYLVDSSSNGTFLNGRRVARGRKTLLAHNDALSVSGAKYKHFIYQGPSREHLRAYPRQLRDRYLVARELGKGACGTVLLGVDRRDYRQVAIKIINKSRVSMLPNAGPKTSVMNEVRILRSVDHPCVIRLEDVIETEKELYIILELADGGELFDKIIEKTRLEEKEAKLHFYQIVSAIAYLHSQQICHRDLKPENILLCSEDEANPVIKVTDLGLSKFVDVHTHLKTFCGTPQYLAPEVLFSRVRGDGSYDLKVDMWSLGVILYILLCGHPPFNPDRPDKPLLRQITEGDYAFPKQHWERISPQAVDLVKQLMTVNPQRRLSADDALKHAWLQDAAIIERAEQLMATQRPAGWARMSVDAVDCLNGILPPELELNSGGSAAPSPSAEDEAKTPTPADGDAKTPSPADEDSKTPSPETPPEEEDKVKETFKRPLDDKPPAGGGACKRVRVAISAE